MAPKKLPPSQPQQPEEEEEEEESSDEEEEEEGSEEEESEAEEENNTSKIPQTQPQSQVKKNSDAQKLTTVPPPQTPSDSEGGEEEDEEEDSEGAPHSPSASNFILKPITPTKPAAKDSKPTSKRPSEAQKDDQKDARSQKKAKVDDDELKKNKPSAVSSKVAASGSGGGAGRVWSDEDIVCLLESLIAFKDEKGAEPSADMAGFSEFVKGKLSVEFSRVQIYEKTRRLKSKFFNYVKKSEKDGEDLVFSNLLEDEAFELSKKIWGGGAGDGKIANGVDDNGNINSSKSIGNAKKSGNVVVSSVDTMKKDKNKGVVVKELVKEENKEDVIKELVRDRGADDFESKYPFLSQSLDVDAGNSMLSAGSLLKENMSLIGDAKAKELEGKWKKLREAEAEVFLEKLDLMKEHAKLVLEGIRKK